MRNTIRRVKRRVTGDTGTVRTDGGTATATESSSRSGLRAYLGEDFVGSLPFWLPPFLLMGFFVYGAIGWNFIISLTDYQGFGSVDYGNLDFEMYTQAFNDPGFISATVHTFVLLLAFTGACLVVGLVMAILVDRKIRFENTFRTIYLLPFSLSFVVTAQFWLWMYNYQNGIVNIVLRTFGLGQYQWIGDPQLVLGAVVFALVWQFSGYAMVVYLAALRAIPTEHYEAAKVDGASTLRMYWRVIIPQLKNAVISAAVVLMVFALKAFDFLYSLVGGFLPPNGSDILATKMVREAFRNQHWAYGSAIAIMLFLLALGIIGPYLINQYRHGNL
ncbi:sugar ABC transporter permease [Haladaptatus sp. DYF46]|uniref:carbohydrate ABC transporter permease n=1 Tax=Haladaptatus sp. DYF46 TaxID=2886041 RepID=UPI001E3DCC54|nr:sugar ABC transporter permease [Haladaptatus sp. DYF46]